MTVPLTDPELAKVDAEFRKQRQSFIVAIFLFMILAVLAPFYGKHGSHPFLDIAPLPVTESISIGLFSIFLVSIYFRQVATIKEDLKTKEKLIVEGELLKKRKSFADKERYVFFIKDVDASSGGKPRKITVDLAEYVSFGLSEKLHMEMTPKANFIFKVSKIKEQPATKTKHK